MPDDVKRPDFNIPSVVSCQLEKMKQLPKQVSDLLDKIKQDEPSSLRPSQALGRAVVEKKLARPLLRVLEVEKADLLKLNNIDYMMHRFDAQLYLSMLIRGGAHDADLCKDSKAFPLDQAGRPTFRPSAAWYLDQFELSNAISSKVIDANIFVDGDDLRIAIRYEGTFHETMELDDFPFDTQGLGIHLSCNVRPSGMTPVDFSLGDPSAKYGKGTIDFNGFAQDALYYLHPTLLMRSHLTGSDPSRLFPMLSVTAIVHRRAMFFTMNAAVPFALFTLLSCLQFAAMPVRVNAAGVELRCSLQTLRLITHRTHPSVGCRDRFLLRFWKCYAQLTFPVRRRMASTTTPR